MQSSSSSSNSSEAIDSVCSERLDIDESAINADLLESFKGLFSTVDVNTSTDALILILHAFMLEVGFIPKDIPETEKLKSLPKNWRQKEMYRIEYYHLTCPEVCCAMICIPLPQDLISVFGAVNVPTSQGPPHFCLHINQFANSKNTGSSDSFYTYFNVRELSINFKDGYVYPLLGFMQDALGFGPVFGLTVVADHVKVQILSYLPVESLSAVACVNKEFSVLCNSKSLWKKLYQRDFRKDPLGKCVSAKDDDWKKLYKEMCVLRRRRRQLIDRNAQLKKRYYGLSPYDQLRPFPKFGNIPDAMAGFPEDLRNAFPEAQRNATGRVTNRRTAFPHNPSLNFPGTFRF